MVTLFNTIVAGNTAFGDLNFSGTFSGMNNLTNGNPLLAPLGDYGGPTQTMPPLAGSPAIDAGDDLVTSVLTDDQRGYSRLSGLHVDLGAAEAQVPPTGISTLLMAPVTAQNTGSLSFSLTNIADADFTVLAATNVALPRSLWTPLGLATQPAPGHYQFTDFDATNYPQRFYQLVWP
jgi:hypothetical protein